MDNKEIEGFIIEINSDIICLLSKFEKLRGLNIIEESMCRNLQSLVSCVDEFIDSNPQDIRLDKSYSDINLDNHEIASVLECSACQCTFEQKNLINHVESWIHTLNISQKHPSTSISLDDAIPMASIDGKFDHSGKTDQDKDLRLLIQQKKEAQLMPEAKLTPEAELKPEATLIPEAPLSASPSVILEHNCQFRLNKVNILQSQTDLGKFLSYVESFKQIDIDADCAEFNRKFCSAVGDTYPNLVLHFHGPRSYGLHDMLSIQDVYCDTGNEYYYYPGPTEDDINYKILKITDSLYEDPNCKWTFSVEDKKYDSAVLQIEMENHPIKYVLSFVNGLQCSRSRIISYMFSLEWKALKSFLVLMKAVQEQDLLNVFNPEIIAQIVIYYYQIFGMLPFIEYLQTNIEPKYIGPWQVNFHRLRCEDEFPYTKFKMTRNWIMVLRRLLNELSHFKFNLFIMCPYLGKKLTQDSQICRMKEFYRYNNYLRNCRDPQPLSINQMCIQDFIELNKNISGNIWADDLKKFKKCLIRLSSSIREHAKSK